MSDIIDYVLGLQEGFSSVIGRASNSLNKFSAQMMPKKRMDLI